VPKRGPAAWCFLLAAILLGQAPSFAAAPQTLRVGVTEFPPGVVAAADGHAEGPAADMIRRIFENAGYRADVRVYPSVRVRSLVTSGDLDASIASRFWDTDGIALYSEQPFGEPKIGLFWTDPKNDVTSLAQLDGKVVIVPLGQFTPAALLRLKAPHAVIEQSRDFAGAIAMLTNGRADYLLDWEGPVQSELDRLGLKVRQLKLPPEYTYVVVSRRVPDAVAIVHRIDAAMRRLVAEGKLPLR